ncbi:MAG: hypothetical protein V8S34_02275 [Lawsonibacter sp.]
MWTLSYLFVRGGTVLGMTLAGAAIGGVSQYAPSQSLPGCPLCGAGAAGRAGRPAHRRGPDLRTGGDLPALLEVAVPECPPSSAMSFIYLLFRRRRQRAGISWRNFCCHCRGAKQRGNPFKVPFSGSCAGKARDG